MESLSCSPFLYRKSLRARSHTPTKPPTAKPVYRYYFRPKDTFEELKTSLRSHIDEMETGLKTYLTEVEDRIDELSTKRGPRRESIKSPGKDSNRSPVKVGEERRTKNLFFPEISKPKLATAANPRSISEEPKALTLRLERSKGVYQHTIKPKMKQKDSLADLLRSDGFEEDFERIEGVIEKLKGDRSELPAPCLDDLLVEVLTRHQLHDAYKRSIWPSREGSTDPMVVFSKACDEMKVAPVPALAKITGKKLILNRYQLQTGLCEALGRTLPSIEMLRIIHLDANAITDAGGAALVAGIAQHGNINSFYYTRNDVGMKVVEGLQALRSSDISDMSFRGCKVSSAALPLLITAALQIKELLKLCLSEVGLTESAITALSKGLKKSRVISLDISWNQINLNSTKAFLTYLRREKRLQYLDYSWNSLASSDNEVAYLMGAILRNHPSLIHLNLSNTQLNDQAIALIIQGLKKSSTCVSLHLTGNSMEVRTVEFIKRHLDARTETQLLSHSAEIRTVPLLPDDLNKSFPVTKRTSHPETSITNIKVRDGYGKQVISHRDNLVNIFQSDTRRMDPSDESHILTRLLGHGEVVNGEQWVYSEHCWVCERWPIFTFTIKESNLRMVDSVDMLTNRYGASGKVALKGSFNNWQELPMQNTIGEEFALSILIPPGLHNFWLVYEEQYICVSSTFRCTEEQHTKINQVMIPIRSTEVQLLEATKQEVVRVFDKDKSVFKAFVEDTEVVVQTMFTNDMKFSKINRVVKNETDFNEVTALLKKNYNDIKAIFDHTAASSNYPTIGWLDFTDFCLMCQLLDKKFLNTAAIDRLFIAVNVELVEQDDNPDRELCRFEFFEILVRMALCKYQDLPLTPTECVRKLFDEHILKYGTASTAIEFRREKLYQVDVNDVLEVNLFNVQTIFAKYKDRRGKYVNIEGIKKMLEKAGIVFNEKELIKAFVFSKMSILDEANANGAHVKMVFVEFLEFIGRLSELVVTDSVPLYTKIERILDSLLPTHGLKRKPVSELQQEDDDY